MLLWQRKCIPKDHVWHCFQTNRTRKWCIQRSFLSYEHLGTGPITAILVFVINYLQKHGPLLVCMDLLIDLTLVMLAQPTRQPLQFCSTVILWGAVCSWEQTKTFRRVILLLLRIRVMKKRYTGLEIFWHFVLGIQSFVTYSNITVLYYWYKYRPDNTILSDKK